MPDGSRRSSRHGFPGLSEHLAAQVAKVARSIRSLDLKKAPSVSETIDWARTLLALSIEDVDEAILGDTLHVLLKYQADIEKAAKELTSSPPPDVLGIITGFIDELRAAGVPVSMVEAIDGMRAVEAVEIGDRIALRETLRATLDQEPAT